MTNDPRWFDARSAITRSNDALVKIANNEPIEARLCAALVIASVVNDHLCALGLNHETDFLDNHPNVELEWAGRNSSIYGLEKSLGFDPDSSTGQTMLSDLFDYFVAASNLARSEVHQLIREH